MIQRQADDLSANSQHNSLLSLWWTTPLWLILGFILIGGGIALWRLGLFDPQQTASDSKLIAAVLALMGGLFTTAITLVGLLLKHSFDRSVLQQNLQSELRRSSEEKDREARLKMETSLRAIELMGSGSSGQQAGVLMALANLDQTAFALGLLNELWKRTDIPTDSAVWLIDRGLSLEDENLQRKASNLLRKFAAELATPDGRFIWPENARGENFGHLCLGAQFNSLEALLRCLTSRKFSEWDGESVNEAFVILLSFISGEGSRVGAALAWQLLVSLTDTDFPEFVQCQEYVAKLLQEKKYDASATGGSIPELLKHLQYWVAEGQRFLEEK